MNKENRFNLIDEPWIPIPNIGKVSLKQLFSNPDYSGLGGNPIQKIAVLKLLLAIAQSAYTPITQQDWVDLDAEGLVTKCLSYLEKNHNSFYLYGTKPFLQMPAIASAEIKSFGAVSPEISTGNTTVLSQSNIEKELDDGEKALTIVLLMGFGLGGKKTDNKAVLSSGYLGKTNDKGKPSTGKAGPSLGFYGYLHNYLLSPTLHRTLWANLLTKEQIEEIAVYPLGIGKAPWEEMPISENCPVAQNLKESLMGRLIPLSRFCLLTDKGLHYSEGITHSTYLDGLVDPTVAVNYSLKKSRVLWVDPEKRPWRQLTALLSFMDQNNSSGFDCYQIRTCLNRVRGNLTNIGIWSGGLRVSSNAGEQYVSGSDDFVDSSILLKAEFLGEVWYAKLTKEINGLDQLSKQIYGCTLHYFKDQNADGKAQAAESSSLFWQLCEREAQNIVTACMDENQVKFIRQKMAGFGQKTYDTFCPRGTARQLEIWAKNRPNLIKYLKQD